MGYHDHTGSHFSFLHIIDATHSKLSHLSVKVPFPLAVVFHALRAFSLDRVGHVIMERKERKRVEWGGPDDFPPLHGGALFGKHA